MQILNQTQIAKLDDAELQKYSQLVGANARKWKNHFVALLPEIARRGIYKKKFTSISEYAAKVGGVGKKTVEAVFQLEKHIADKPALKELIPEVGLNKVRVVARIATKENQKELAIKVKTMTKSALEEVARSERNNKTLFSQIPPGRNREREYIGFHMSKKNALELRKFKLKLEKQKKQKVDFNEVLEELLKIAKEDPKKVRSRKTKPGKSRGVGAAQKRDLENTHNGCCAYPGCNKPSTQFHHPDRFALNGSHNRIVPLCDTHHELAHQGLIENEEKPPNEWFIRKNPDKTHPKYKIDQKVMTYKMLCC